MHNVFCRMNITHIESLQNYNSEPSKSEIQVHEEQMQEEITLRKSDLGNSMGGVDEDHSLDVAMVR